MIYQVVHTTRYRYQKTVSQCLSEARITPRAFPGQRVFQSRIEVIPEPALFDVRTDYFGNEVATFSVFRSHDLFSVCATSTVEVEPSVEGPSTNLSWEDARTMVDKHLDAKSLEAYEFRFDSPFVQSSSALREYGAPTFTPGRSLVATVRELAHRIHEEFSYSPKSTSIDMPLPEILKGRKGVCQDFAHVMIGVLRSFSLSARYVSGYLRSGAKYVGVEASHAWVSVYIPGYGWLDLDPTNDLLPGEGHVTVAWGRDFGDVTPVKGVSLGGGGQTVEVEVKVLPLALAEAT